MTYEITLLAQADLLQLIAKLFRAPTSECRHGLQGIGEDLLDLLRHAGLGDAESVLGRGLLETCALAIETPLEDWADEHTRLFEGGIACPINETAYIRRDKGVLLADIAGFYRAFGLDLAHDTAEKPDHLISELEFMSLLLLMLSKASTAGDEQASEVTRDAINSFAADHLGEWLGGFCVRLGETTALPLFVNLAALLVETWSALCAYHELSASTQKVLVCAEETGTPYECGMAEAGKR